MHTWRVRHEVSQVNVRFVLVVVNAVRTVQDHQPSPSTTMKPALDRRHRILHLHQFLACIALLTVKEPMDLNIVTLDRFLRPSFHPKHGFIVTAILSDVIEHRLRLAHPTKPAHHQNSRVILCVIALIVQLLFDLLMQPRARDIVDNWSK